MRHLKFKDALFFDGLVTKLFEVLIKTMNETPQAIILLVDDVQENISLIYEFLQQGDFKVLIAEDGQTALNIAAIESIDLVLMDVMMPGMDGFETCRRLKAEPRNCDVPVIFMTALHDAEYKLKGFAAGGVDYLNKPVQPEELRARINIHLHLRALQRRLREKNHLLHDKNRELQHALQQHQAVLDNAQAGIVFLDADRRIQKLNDTFAHCFAWSKQELLGQHMAKLYLSEEDSQLIDTRAYPLFSSGSVFAGEALMQRKNGARFYASLRGKAIDADDLSQGTVWSIEDIDVRKAADDELRMRAAVLDNMSEAVLVCDTAARILRVNPAFTRLFGYAADEVMGRSPKLLSSGLHKKAFYDAMWTDLLAHGIWQGEVWNRHKDGRVFPISSRMMAVRRTEGSLSHYVAIMKTAESDTSADLAVYDALTGLPKRSLLYARLHQALKRAKQEKLALAVLIIDLDNFHQINAELGHANGDKVLTNTAARLQQMFGEPDIVARLDDDEFVVIVSDAGQIKEIDALAKRLLDQLALSVDSSLGLSLSASIGAAFYPDHGDHEETLLRQADAAMNQARRMGGNTFCRTPIARAEADLRPRLQNQSRLLYIEDNPVDALLVSAVLEHEGYQVDTAASAAEALQRWEATDYALSLIDYQLPDMNGMELLARARRAYPAMAVVMVTGQEDISVAVDAMRAGAADYVRKDENLPALLPVVVARTLMGKRLHQLQQQARQADEEKSLYRGIFDTAFVALLILDEGGRIIDANQTACTLSGYRQEELTHLYMPLLFPAQEYARVRDFLDHRRDFPPCEAVMLCRDGGSISIELQRSRLDYHGQAHWLALIHDISERKRAESRLRQAVAVFEHASEAIFITDPHAHIIGVNRAFTRISGYQESEVLGKNPKIFKSGRHDPAFYQSLWEAVANLGSWHGEIWNRRKNGEVFAAWQEISKVCDEQGQVQHYISIFSDITERKLFAERIHQLQHYDPLTNLPNRVLFRERLGHALTQAVRQDRQLALIYFGIDRFKSVNDSLGPLAGDELLQACAARLSAELNDNIYLGRMSSDEFACFFSCGKNIAASQATALVLRLQALFKKPFTVGEQVLHLSVSLGISLCPRDGDNPDTLLKNANTAMSRAKRKGRNIHQFYAEELTAEAQTRLRLENGLRQTVNLLPVAGSKPDEDAPGGFYLCYQPQINLSDKRLCGCEVLIRWQHPELGLVMPDRFIAIAEESTLILHIDEWVLRSACHQMRAWLDSGITLPSLAVNLSAMQLQREDLVELVEDALDQAALPPHYLELEITEGLFIGELERASTVLDSLRACGVRLAIDDFGAGYSSLSYLEQLRVDKIKLDRSLLEGVGDNPDKGKVAAATIALGRALQLKVLCEGVENQAQEDFLRACECDETQGFFYSRPLKSADFVSFFAQQSSHSETSL
jgi:diguanylate cyclase (GGDEF)-like protein/PAS domain S-box-containing protein